MEPNHLSLKSKPANRKFIVGAVIAFTLIAAFMVATMGSGSKSVARIAHADPALQAASKKAQEGLPDFIKELLSPKPGEGFAVKGAFKTPSGLEYLWVRSPSYKDDEFTGTLDQVPIALPGKKKGDTVVVKKKDVFDWLIKDENGIRGMETEKVLQSQSGR